MDDKKLEKIVEEAVEKYDQPAMAVAIAEGESIMARTIVGTAEYGKDLSLNLEKSRFHVGSTTKPMTATLIAILVEEGKLSWETTIRQVFPDMPMRNEYGDMTIHHFLTSTAGVIPMQDEGKESWGHDLFNKLPKEIQNPKQQRRELTKRALNYAPVATPGTTFIYSNAGWAILGAIAETVTGISYENLMKAEIFDRLGMRSAKVGGWPASSEEPEQPRGHYGKILNPYTGEYLFEKHEKPFPQELDDEYVFPAWMNPAGGIHMNISDFLLFAQDQLLGLQGKGKLMSQPYYQKLHQENKLESDTGASMKVGYGFGLAELGLINTTRISAADGSGGTFYARLLIAPKINVVAVFFSNCGNGQKAITEIMMRLI
jgi:CubicO group peptidase (beta-lactamase class C family)